MVMVQEATHRQMGTARHVVPIALLAFVVGLVALSALTLGIAKLSGDITGQSTIAAWVPWGPWVVIPATFGIVMVALLGYVCIKTMDEQVPPPFSK